MALYWFSFAFPGGDKMNLAQIIAQVPTPLALRKVEPVTRRGSYNRRPNVMEDALKLYRVGPITAGDLSRALHIEQTHATYLRNKLIAMGSIEPADVIRIAGLNGKAGRYVTRYNAK